MVRTVYLGLGSDVGDRRGHLRRGIEGLVLAGLFPLSQSSVWESAGLDTPAPSSFLNMAVRVDTDRPAEEILVALQRIEADAGRTPGERNAPRTLDLDLLWVEGEARDGPGLQLPHPRMWQRAFVLLPLDEIAPELCLPGSAEPVGEAGRRLAGAQELRCVGPLASPRSEPL